MTKTTLIATIGNRDLMFQTANGDWFNIGEDQMREDIIEQNILSEQDQVLADLKLDTANFRDLTQFLLDHVDVYGDRIKPVIMGQLLNERSAEIDTVYLLGTDQPPNVLPHYRAKDTLFACELMKWWLERYHSHITVHIILIGTDGTNPSDFESMFQWWRKMWRSQFVIPPDQQIWLCLKGGIGQVAEAGRTSGLSQYGDRIQFFEFTQTPKQNRQGIPSEYSGPLLSTHYLWDRVQKQALQLLDRRDYAGVEELLKSYFAQHSSTFGSVPKKLKGAIAWNQGDFEAFQKYIQDGLTQSAHWQLSQWWWMAYEQAYLAVVRFEQKSTSEAMTHSFRSIEGAIWVWIKHTIADHVKEQPRRYPQLLDSILTPYPTLENDFIDKTTNKRKDSINLNGYVQEALIQAAIPATCHSRDFKAFWSQETRDYRNRLSHQLGGITENMLFDAWGDGVHNQPTWETRILNCLNLITGRSMFKSIAKASLLTDVHTQLREAIATIEL
jgi:hypothetical protein